MPGILSLMSFVAEAAAHSTGAGSTLPPPPRNPKIDSPDEALGCGGAMEVPSPQDT